MSDKTADRLEYWLIYFEDADRPPEVFTDRAVATERYKQLSQNWTCHLFGNAEALAAARREGAEEMRERCNAEISVANAAREYVRAMQLKSTPASEHPDTVRLLRHELVSAVDRLAAIRALEPKA